MIVCGLPIVLDNSKFIDVQSVHILEPSVETFVNEDIKNKNKRSGVIIKPKYGIREFDIIATNQITKTLKHVYLHFDAKPDNDDLSNKYTWRLVSRDTIFIFVKILSKHL